MEPHHERGGRSGPLRPFRDDPHLDGFSLGCDARWHGGRLTLSYTLRGPLQDLVLPKPLAPPQRRDGLWESTCFEAFLASPGESAYWELNLAANGDWNVYRLSGYRQDLQPEIRVGSLPARISGGPGDGGAGTLSVGVELALGALIEAERGLELSATAVLEHRHRGCSHWAWHHAGEEADFHRRDSFMPL